MIGFDVFLPVEHDVTNRFVRKGHVLKLWPLKLEEAYKKTCYFINFFISWKNGGL